MKKMYMFIISLHRPLPNLCPTSYGTKKWILCAQYIHNLVRTPTKEPLKG